MCTNLRMRATDGSVVVGRSMEFAADLGWQLLVSPRGSEFTGTAPGGDGHRWTATHGFVGVNALGRNIVTDGLNEAGLFAALLYLPGLAGYEDDDGIDAARLISADEIATIALASSATVEEAVAALEAVVVWNRHEEQLGGGILPVHLAMHDRQGGFAVIEWIGGVRRVHGSPIGVCTNSPGFDWHITNLSNYVNLSAVNAGPVDIDAMSIAALGQGSGLLGLPGDWTPPSRFVRAATISAATWPAEDGPASVLATLHMLNTFDIPLGLVRGSEGDERTQWVTVADLANGTYLVRSYGDPTPRQLCLDDLGLADGGPVRTVQIPVDPRPVAFPL